MAEKEQSGMLRIVVVLGIIAIIAGVLISSLQVLKGKMAEKTNQTTIKVDSAVAGHPVGPGSYEANGFKTNTWYGRTILCDNQPGDRQKAIDKVPGVAYPNELGDHFAYSFQDGADLYSKWDDATGSFTNEVFYLWGSSASKYYHFDQTTHQIVKNTGV